MIDPTRRPEIAGPPAVGERRPAVPDGLLIQALEASDDGVLAYDREVRFVLWSRGMERISGLSAREALGRNAFELLPFLVESGEDELIRGALAGRSSSSRERPFEVAASGRRGLYHSRYLPWRSDRGEILGGIGVVRDVTAARAAEAEQQEAERRFQTMADAAPVLLWMAGPDGYCTFFNQTWLTFSGRTLEEEWGVGWAEGVHVEDFQRCMDTYVDAFNRREVFEMEYRLRRADGVYRWILDRGTPRYGPGGRFAGYIGSCVDITERKELEIELRRAVRARDEFLSIASHELRTPLTSLQLTVESLLSGAARRPDDLVASGKLTRKLATAVDQSLHLGTLIGALLDVSRVADGHLLLDRQPCDLAIAVRAALARLARAAERAGCAIEVRGDGPLAGEWDRVRVEQVVTNLVSNALKYAAGAPVTVALSGDDDEVALEVRDRGIGIAREHQRDIFERFSRFVPARSYSGFGLGLWIARAIVEAHGGAITVDSEPGAGATFRVRLPRKSEEPCR